MVKALKIDAAKTALKIGDVVKALKIDAVVKVLVKGEAEKELNTHGMAEPRRGIYVFITS